MATPDDRFEVLRDLIRLFKAEDRPLADDLIAYADWIITGKAASIVNEDTSSLIGLDDLGSMHHGCHAGRG